MSDVRQSDEVSGHAWRIAQGRRVVRLCKELGVKNPEDLIPEQMAPVLDENGKIRPEPQDFEEGDLMSTEEIEYLDEPPTLIPPDRVLMHNVVAGGPNRVISSGGFRVWLAEPGQPNQMPCDCGWAGLGPHVRTKRG